jgi:hypothetical protein
MPDYVSVNERIKGLRPSNISPVGHGSPRMVEEQEPDQVKLWI